MKLFFDIIVYVVYRTMIDKNANEISIMESTRKITYGIFLMSGSSLPIFLIFILFPKIKEHVSSTPDAVQLLLTIGPFLITLQSIIFLVEKRYTNERILSISNRYGDKLPVWIAALLTILMLCISLIAMIIFLAGTMAT